MTAPADAQCSCNDETLARCPVHGAPADAKRCKVNDWCSLGRDHLGTCHFTAARPPAPPERVGPVAMVVPIEPFKNDRGQLCGLCDGTHEHEHGMSRCSACGTVGLTENLIGPVERHVCKEPDRDCVTTPDGGCVGTRCMHDKQVDPPAPASAETLPSSAFAAGTVAIGGYACCQGVSGQWYRWGIRGDRYGWVPWEGPPASAEYVAQQSVAQKRQSSASAETGPKLSERIREARKNGWGIVGWESLADEVAALEARLQEALDENDRLRRMYTGTMDHSDEIGRLRKQLAEASKPPVDAEAVRERFVRAVAQYGVMDSWKAVNVADCLLAKFHVTPMSGT